MSDLAWLKALAECPICTEVPRDGVMLQCRTGHNICSSCKVKLGGDATCPTGRCDFLNPPTKNFTVRDLIESLPIEFPCKFANTADDDSSKCVFKGTKKQLMAHEADCEHRLVPCPNDCDELVPFAKVVEHCKQNHTQSIYAGGLYENSDKYRGRWMYENHCEQNEKEEGFVKLVVHVQKMRAGWAFFSVNVVHDHAYIWMQLLASSEKANEFKCQIELVTDNCTMGWIAPVYPVDWTKERIMEDEDCVRLSVSHIRKTLVEEPNEHDFDNIFSSNTITYNMSLK